MVEAWLKDTQAQLQAYLNCLELCQALGRQTSDPDVRQALALLTDDLQESLTSLASHLRHGGVAPGLYEVDRRGQARIREVLGMRALHSQLRAIRHSLAELVAWYAAHPPTDQAVPSSHDWLITLSAQAQRMLDNWDQHMREMKAGM